MTRYKSPLGKLIPEPVDSEQVKADGFWRHGILVIDMNNDPMDWVEREVFTQWARRRFPKKRGDK